ncbi:uncharacterized protein BP5553_02554 [Venustampulla echinocandica]|uniref:Uncharacterized protein n=1 Tax=Venustampulla echinocandica TaxID=2656787 RepID=A0A370TRU1_9HELO|nr:uncharacterized protein BP5553_02554 [Venustampulla echinocandica]RDL38214.1 hypothetical protein BP5553_02554 [Venustampulla echinocandica]
MDPALKTHKRKRSHDRRSREDLQQLKQKKRNVSHERGDERVNMVDVASSKSIPPASHSSAKAVPSRSEKISSLLRALDEVLDENDADDTLNLIGDEVRNKCRDLQTTIQSISNIDPPSGPRSHDRGIASTLSAHITPWKASEIRNSFPPLPAILDSTLEEATFCHPSASTAKFMFMNYEHLEWVGDAYIEMLTTLLISQSFQNLNPGKLTELRERLIKNAQLEKYSRHYGFDKRLTLNINPDSMGKDVMVKIMGDVFEAYVAAVILSDPVNGFSRAADWLKNLWGVTLKKEIAAEERREKMHLNPMWNLVGSARQALVLSTSYNSKDQLQQALGGKGIRLEYREVAPPSKDRHTDVPIYTVGIFLEGWGAKGLSLGRGSARSKKEAGMKAAEMAMKNKKLLAPYVEKKKLFDAQVELERQALEVAQAAGSIST